MDEQGAPALQMTGIGKRFPGTIAVDGVDFEARAGEVHALMGENGAGKSTLMKILAGSFNDYTGNILIGGREVRLDTPAQARANGIAMIYQELSLAPPVSVSENVLAGRLPAAHRVLLDGRALEREAGECLRRVGLDLDPSTPIEDLSLHEAQLVEIAKALGTNPCILVMDEPTSALSRGEVDRLFEIVCRLKDEGLAIVYISHHLPEVFRIADRVTVLRDGRKVGTHPIGKVSSESLVEMMVGGAVSDLYAERTSPPGEPLLRAEALSRCGFFHNISFELREREILGICGLAGAGRSELVRSMCGIDPLDEGCVFLRDEEITPEDYSDAIRAGLAYLTEDRKANGLALRMTMSENLLSSVIPRHCAFGIYLSGRGREPVSRLSGALKVQPPEPDREAANFSGGNQQKILLAKWLATDPEVLILDEPTRGVDVGAKAVIHKAIAETADRGKGVILISSDLPELVGLSDRILVMREGHFTGELTGEDRTEERALLAANRERGDW